MNMKTTLALLIILLLAPLAALQAADFLVSPHGNDANSGTQTRPSAPLERGPNAAREARASQPGFREIPAAVVRPCEPLEEVDLAGAWDFRPQGGAWRKIQVPAGGWLKQGVDCEAATYQRRIRIPDSSRPQVVRLELGAVNHLAEYSIGPDESSLRPIGRQFTAFTPQVVDLTPHVEPGREYLLRVFVRAFERGRPVAPHWAEWCESIARGIFRDAWLRLYPSVFISDTQIKTRVADRTLRCGVWLSNASGRNRQVTLGGRLVSWNGTAWRYPSIAAQTVRIPAGATVEVRLGPVTWSPGPESYWHPDLPYDPGYRAQLHWLHLELREGNGILASSRTRFGFREIRQAGDHYELNGVRINFRGDNLQVANYDRINHGGRGDAIDTLPGFLPPSKTNAGWPQAVQNFLRLNYNVQREHMGPWTPYMIDVCDELGLMLIGESATRWNGFDMENGRGFHEAKFLQDIVRRDKNHPSIIRWSTKNEAQSLDPAYHLELYDAVKAIDDTRPISEDILCEDPNRFDVRQVFARLRDKPDFTWIDHYLAYDGQGKPFFTTIEHNDAVIPMKERPFGLGEGDWMRSSTPTGLAWFAATTVLGRAQGASDVRPYVLLSSWASSIPGVKTTDFLTEENRHPVFGEDNLPDPWTHPGIQLLQTACHPLLAADVEFWKLNRKSDAHGHFPVASPQVQAKSRAQRMITVFNDDLAGEALELVWELREGSPSNWIFDKGAKRLELPPGSSRSTPIGFRTPRFNTFLFLTLKVLKNGQERFRDGRTFFEVVNGENFRPEFNSERPEFK
jgi:hypothetical protein